jgi:rfaE bifunctional protein kinase chain/domain
MKKRLNPGENKMVEIYPDRLQEIIRNGTGKRILVLGDLMIDRYLWGNVSRISPEAPVPIIGIEDEEVRFGGAANVANNLIGLNAEPVLVGTVGEDPWGKLFRKRLMEKKLFPKGLITDNSRPTTIKTRIIGNNQHIARVDREEAFPINSSVQGKIYNFIADIIHKIDAIILEDYNKGVLVPELVQKVIDLANEHQKITTVDPKFDNFFAYRDVTLFKPNRKETAGALAMRLDTDESFEQAGDILLERLNAQAILITLGPRGMALFRKNKPASFEGTRAREVADVSGAGDTVIATVTFALAAGATMKEAVAMANFAAGVVCEEVGVVPIHTEELLQAMIKS